MTGKQRIHATVRGEPHDQIPVTPLFMQWAARFVGRSYRDYYLNGQVLADAQVAVARALNTDHVSAISDPWTEADAYGLRLDYPDNGVGVPRAFILKSPGDVKKLNRLDPQTMPRLQERLKAIAKLAADVGQTHCVVGWIEGPIAQYCNLRGLQDAMTDLMDEPRLFHQAAEFFVHNAAAFARAQAAAGADIIGVGDAAASLVGPELYVEHVLTWETKLIRKLHDAGLLVKLHICGNTNAILKHVAKAGADIIDLDWMVPVGKARQLVGPNFTLAGNFDPSAVLLQGDPLQVAAAARRCITEGGDRFILQPGCEVPPGTALTNLRAFCPGEACLIPDALALEG